MPGCLQRDTHVARGGDQDATTEVGQEEDSVMYN